MKDTEFTDNIICPHCGYVFNDSWEYSVDMNDGDTYVLECDDCGKEFELEVHISIEYSTFKEFD